MCRERSTGCRNPFLGCKAARGSEQWDQKQETADEHGQTGRQVVPGRICVKARKSASIVSCSAGVGVQNLAESVRPVIVQVCRRGSRWVPIAFLLESNDGSQSTKY